PQDLFSGKAKFLRKKCKVVIFHKLRHKNGLKDCANSQFSGEILPYIVDLKRAYTSVGGFC
ncbi:MAG: hypothetical protein KDK26_17245, partial [Roseivivax sp.]|nr:hypothetical protein [Roseivivax sp.]